MAEKLSKSQLEAKKVVELKEIAENSNITIDGLKKHEIIEAILSTYSDENDIEDTNEEPESLDEIVEVVEKVEPEIKKEFKPYRKILNKPFMLYKDADMKVPNTNIIGLVEVVEEFPKSLKVTRLVSGRGILTGYILK